MGVREDIRVVSEVIEETVEREHTVRSYHCDAYDCDATLTVEADEFGEIVSLYGAGADRGDRTDWDVWAEDGLDGVAVGCGWQQGSRGIQRGHWYCPEHWEDPTLWA